MIYSVGFESRQRYVRKLADNNGRSSAVFLAHSYMLDSPHKSSNPTETRLYIGCSRNFLVLRTEVRQE